MIASLLIIQRVANKSALTGNSVVSRHTSGPKFRTQECLTDGSGTLPGGRDPMDSVDGCGTSSAELEAGTVIDVHGDKA